MDFSLNEPVIGFAPVARTTFDIPLAQSLADAARQQLAASGCGIFGPDELITDLVMAGEVADEMAAVALDALVVFQATFADSTMIVRLTDGLDIPVILWAVPEERTGGRLRLNSLCGINLGGHALKRAGRDYDYVYAQPGDSVVTETILSLARAGWVRRQLAGARLGRSRAGLAAAHTARSYYIIL